ncbi:hypothetical protein BBU94A_I04 (plasmid) [Borreliella burgdorferi 94a]|nr:hypothetical protein BBU94A_I04 [Borreliella burgdorferi 94a]
MPKHKFCYCLNYFRVYICIKFKLVFSINEIIFCILVKYNFTLILIKNKIFGLTNRLQCPH